MNSYLLTIDENADIPEEIKEFTPKENLLMILIGYNAIKLMKNNTIDVNYSQYIESLKTELKEQYESIIKTKEESINSITITAAAQKSFYDQLLQEEKDKRVDEVMRHTMREKQRMDEEIVKLKELYENQYNILSSEKKQIQEIADALSRELVTTQTVLENMKKNVENEVTILLLKEKEKLTAREKELIKNESQNNTVLTEKLQEEIAKNAALQEKLNELLIQHEKEHNRKLHENLYNTNKMIDELTKNVEELKNSKGNVGRGQIGETFFHDLVIETFEEYEGFSITNTAKTGHSGDFHIQFKDFTILADSKNFVDTSGVSSTDRNKLKYDMTQNTHIKIAWLVSIDKPIRKFSKYPFMIDIRDGVCYCYINSLKNYENPSKILSMAWYACYIVFHNILNREDDVLILNKYKKNEIRIREIVEKMRRKSKERYACLKQLTENFDETEKDILQILNDEIMNIRDIHAKTAEKWWNEKLELVPPAAETGSTLPPPRKIKSNIIYKEFQKENPEINEEMFRQILKDLIPVENLEIPKSKNAQYTILNYQWRQQE